MKKMHLIILFSLFFYFVAQAQFNVCPYSNYNMGIIYSHAVGDEVYWASRRDVTGTIVTADGGNTWTVNICVDPRAFPVYCIHAFDANTAFITASTIYKTADRGTTWTPAAGVFTNSASFPNTIHFFDQNNGVAMGDPVDGYFEIYTTSNAGVNWDRVPQNNIPAPLTGEIGLVNDQAYFDNSYWFPTNKQRIFKSTDLGYTWTCSQFPAAGTDLWPSLAFRNELNGLGLSVIGSSLILGKTSDGGNTWIYEMLPGWVYGAMDIAYITGTQSTYTLNTISRLGTELKNMILITNNDGLTWNKLDDWGPSSSSGYHLWTSVNSGWGSIYNGGEGCIYHWPGYTGKHIWRAGNNLKFKTTVTGELRDTMTVSIGSFGTLPTTINTLNLSSANFSVVNAPATPLVLQPWECIELKIAFTPQTRGIFNDSLMIISDAANYSSLSVNLSGKALAFTPPASDLIYAASDSLYTINFSNPAPIPVGSFEGLEINGMAVNPIDSVLIGISMGTSSSTLYKIDPVLGGCVPLVTIPEGNIRAIAFAPSGTLFAAKKTGSLYKINLTTGEATLIGTSSGVQYASITFSPVDGRLFASVSKIIGTGKDMICVVDTSTADTTLIGFTGDGKSTPSITFDIEDNTLYGLKGTQTEENKLITINTNNGSGTEIASLGISGLQTVFISSIIVGVESEIKNTPISHELYQNFPNPFNPSTKIKYSIPQSTNVVIKVFDVLGNEIATLLDEEKSVGTYELTWNAENLPSGVYFYQLKTGSYIETKKMLLLK